MREGLPGHGAPKRIPDARRGGSKTSCNPKPTDHILSIITPAGAYEAERLMVPSGTFRTYDTYTSSNKYDLWFIWKLSGRLIPNNT